ncbi:GNAT family N-acetyltransferase [Dongshaea marina]|uniref:GNAT family N-acetyltransferase n=1 Tax=Dongshaea marina TaxID=2047966 RepID=UPI000D3EC80A|nr:GNAT family N-acetyltransferase [Dongshaea marina]
MEFSVSSTANESEKKEIVDSLWEYNSQFEPVEIIPLRVTLRDEKGVLLGGLVAETWWGGLDIQYLWVNPEYHKQGLGTKLMRMAEEEARKRGCHMAYVDTLSFQAIGFYQKLGYSEFGTSKDFAHKYSRHYLQRSL